MRFLCNFAHKWGRWDFWFPIGQRQARHCLRCKVIEVRNIAP